MTDKSYPLLAVIIYSRFAYPWRFTRVPSVITVDTGILLNKIDMNSPYGECQKTLFGYTSNSTFQTDQKVN